MHTTIRTAEMRLAPPRHPPLDAVFMGDRNPLHYAIDLLRSVNQANRLTPDVKRQAQEMASNGQCHKFLAGWGTVSCAAGRRTGHTSYIVEKAEKHDLVIVPGYANPRAYRDCQAPVVSLQKLEHRNQFRSHVPKTIYVDDATRMFSEFPLDLLYHLLGLNEAQTFILLG